MQKWEYLFVSCAMERNAWRPRYVNGQEPGDWKIGPPYHESSNQLGDQGWELVSSEPVVTTLAPVGVNYVIAIGMIFKRPKP